MPIDRAIVYRVVDRTKKGLTQLDRNLKQAERSATGLGGKAKAVGVAVGALGVTAVAAGAAIVTSQIRAAEQIQKTALRTGLATETLSKWRFAAEQSGASLDNLARGQQAFARILLQGQEGVATATRTFDALGVTLDDFEGKTFEQQFLTLSDAIKNVEDPTERLALAQRALGRAGSELLPLMLEGAEGINRLGAEAERTGNIITQDFADKSATTVDAMNTLRHSVTGLGIGLASGLAPAITTVAEGLSGFVGWVKNSLDPVAQAEQRASEYEETLRRLSNTIREEVQYSISVADARVRAAEAIDVARTATESYIAASIRLSASNEQVGWGPYTDSVQSAGDALVEVALAQGMVAFESPAVVEGLYAEAAAFRAATAAVRAQISDLRVLASVRAEALRAEGRAASRVHQQLGSQQFLDAQTIPGEQGVAVGQYDPSRLKELGLVWESSTREWVDAVETNSRSVSGGGGVARSVEDSAEKAEKAAERARRQQAEQIESLYAANRISEDQYQALRESNDIGTTLADLTATASAQELSALDQVRATAYRVGDLTAAGSRTIVAAIQTLSAALRSQQRPRGRGPTGPTPHDDEGDLRTIRREAVGDYFDDPSRGFVGPPDAAGRPKSNVNQLTDSEVDRLGSGIGLPEFQADYQIPSFARGGTLVADRPTLALFGEAGPERATFTPLRGGAGGGGTMIVNVVVDGRVLATGQVAEVQRSLDRGELTIHATG